MDIAISTLRSVTIDFTWDRQGDHRAVGEDDARILSKLVVESFSAEYVAHSMIMNEDVINLIRHAEIQPGYGSIRRA